MSPAGVDKPVTPLYPTPMNVSAQSITSTPTFMGIVADAVFDDPYANSPFKPLKSLASRTKGAAFERIISEILTDQGHEVLPPQSSEYDRLVDGKRVEIKGSFLWGNRGYFRWQQIRANQEYDAILFLSFYPDYLDVHFATKEVAIQNLSAADSEGRYPHNQHGGMTQDSGTYYMQGVPEDFPWLTPFTAETKFI